MVQEKTFLWPALSGHSDQKELIFANDQCVLFFVFLFNSIFVDFDFWQTNQGLCLLHCVKLSISSILNRLEKQCV